MSQFSQMKYTVVHRMDKNNVGDMASEPLQYFLPRHEYRVIDIVTLDRMGYPKETNLIIGGGGLIANDNFAKPMQEMVEHPDRSRLKELYRNSWKLADRSLRDTHHEFTSKFEAIIKAAYDDIPNKINFTALWGVGHNENVTHRRGKDPVIEYPSNLIDYDMVSLRDYNMGHEWVPCASCMHGALQNNFPIRNDIIWFEHKKQLIKNFGDMSIPRFINSGNNVEQIIEILGSANTIITNSYHGAYWGTLLKKRVIVMDPWSSKFYFLKHKPVLADSKSFNFEQAYDEAEIYDDALDECMETNRQYWDKIQERVG